MTELTLREARLLAALLQFRRLYGGRVWMPGNFAQLVDGLNSKLPGAVELAGGGDAGPDAARLASTDEARALAEQAEVLAALALD